MPVPKGIELIQALMTEENLQPRDLISIFDDESTVTKILEKKQKITVRQIQKLSEFFHISPIIFSSSE